MKKNILIAVLIILMIGLGFVRDHVFVSLNHLIETGNDPRGRLSMLKWMLTFAFSFFYFVNTSALLFALFPSKKYVLVTVYTYVFLFAISFLAVVSGYLLTSFKNAYPFARMVMGVAQSPVIVMLLVPAGWMGEALKKDLPDK